MAGNDIHEINVRAATGLYTTVPSSSIESTINVTWYARTGDEATINAEVKRVIETEESSGRRKKKASMDFR